MSLNLNEEMEYRKKIFKLKSEIRKLEKEKYNTDKLLSIYKNIAEKQNKKLDLLTASFDAVTGSKVWKFNEKLRKMIGRQSIVIPLMDENNNVGTESNYSNYEIYSAEYEENKDFSGCKSSTKPIAFYLPQYHCFKENDEWWGKDFTEWTNTSKSMPKFKGHYQPREPHEDIGYYHLDNIETIKKQILLAKQHGIYGFCFYYYWFSGKRLMEKPGDLLLEHQEIDFPFCLCWANENFTRTWDGKEDDILIKQDYTDKDPEQFIIDIKKYMIDNKYIKIEDKPLLLVYNPGAIPNFDSVVLKWRETARRIGLGELYILAKSSVYNDSLEFIDAVDGEFDFPPNGIDQTGNELDGVEDANLYNYEGMVNNLIQEYDRHFSVKPYYYCCTLGWDNAARRDSGYTTFVNYSTKSFKKWLSKIVEMTKITHASEEQYFFINAWNEWAEGTYLEPDKKYGYVNLNTVSTVVFDRKTTK